MPNLTKSEVVINLSNEAGIKHSTVEEIVEGFLRIVSQNLAEGRNVALRGFGSFSVRIARAKVGRNPARPGSEKTIPRHCVVKFKPCVELKRTVANVPAESIEPPGKLKVAKDDLFD